MGLTFDNQPAGAALAKTIGEILLPTYDDLKRYELVDLDDTIATMHDHIATATDSMKSPFERDEALKGVSDAAGECKALLQKGKASRPWSDDTDDKEDPESDNSEAVLLGDIEEAIEMARQLSETTRYIIRQATQLADLPKSGADQESIVEDPTFGRRAQAVPLWLHLSRRSEIFRSSYKAAKRDLEGHHAEGNEVHDEAVTIGHCLLGTFDRTERSCLVHLPSMIRFSSKVRSFAELINRSSSVTTSASPLTVLTDLAEEALQLASICEQATDKIFVEGYKSFLREQ